MPGIAWTHLVVVTESSVLRAFYGRNNRVGPGRPILEEDGDLGPCDHRHELGDAHHGRAGSDN